MKHRSAITQYLEFTTNFRKLHIPSPDFKYSCFEDFVLNVGQPFINYIKRPKWVRKGVIKQCFKNCFDEVLRYPDKLTYCEGYATGVIPVHHAWCLTKDGEVIDPTWDGRDIGNKNIEYFGVPFKRSYILKVALETGYYGAIDNWSQKFPLLTEEHKTEDFLETFFAEAA
jgi:hypothetical protein